MSNHPIYNVLDKHEVVIRMKKKNWLILVLGMILLGLIVTAGFTIVIDPFFHYHKGIKGLEYPMNDERYQNDGIQRHYEYEIMLTGTSMSQNFNASKIEELWGCKAIKTAYSGATFHELGQSMRNALRHNENLNTIICSFDPNFMGTAADEDTYTGTPDYLYDENPFNDVYYVLNIDILMKSVAVLNYTRAGNKTPSMDAYGRFDTYLPSGREAVLGSFTRAEEADLSHPFTEEDKAKIYDNVMSNYVQLARDYPDVNFIFYLPPYSYCYWDALVRTNQVDYALEVISYATGLMLTEENISVYAFDDWIDVTTNLDYYTDTLHYTGRVCDRMTEAMHEGTNRLSLDSYQAYFEKIKKIYKEMNYDY